MTTATLDLSYIVFSTRGLDDTRATLASLAETLPGADTLPSQLIFSGPAAEEADPELLLGLGVAFQAAQNPEEINIALANALEIFDTEWVLAISDDIRLTPGWFDVFDTLASEHPEFVLFSPTIRYPDGSERLTNEPAAGEGICLLISRSHIVAGHNIGSVVHVRESTVTVA